MDESHDIEHASAECFFQHQYFRDIIISEREDANISVYNTYKNKIDDLNKYDAFLWTGGLGSIYETNSHNKNQIEICEKILKLDKPLWGSCWGLQVIAYCYGDVIKKSKKPEFGYSEKIEIIKNHKSYKDKINYLIIEDLPTLGFPMIETYPQYCLSIFRFKMIKSFFCYNNFCLSFRAS